MKNYSFQKFTSNNTRLESRVTITRNYAIGFPTKFYNDNNFANYKYVVLYYDTENRAIAIKPTNAEEEGRISILKSKQGYGGHIIAKSFFKMHNISVEDYRGRHEWQKLPAPQLGLAPEGHVFIIELSPYKEN
ncbi:hypothetical protein HYX70_05245 [Candidatus Saccharibacteria bacterium]|nr:hypothetical protein [Candidatus Saccharibacteria bacterium]